MWAEEAREAENGSTTSWAKQWTGEAYWAGGYGWWGEGRVAGCLLHQLLDGHPYCQAWVRAGGCLLAHGGVGSPGMVSAKRKGVGSVGTTSFLPPTVA